MISSMYIMRTLVDIPEKSLEALNAMAKAKKVSRAELVREAIAEYVKTREENQTGSGIERSAGAWGKDFEDGLAYQLRLRGRVGRSVKYLFDSNILIDHLRNVTAATAELKRYSRESKSISVITWIEVMAGVNPTTESVTRGLLEEFIVLSMSDEVAEADRRDPPGAAIETAGRHHLGNGGGPWQAACHQKQQRTFRRIILRYVFLMCCR